MARSGVGTQDFITGGGTATNTLIVDPMINNLTNPTAKGKRDRVQNITCSRRTARRGAAWRSRAWPPTCSTWGC